MPRRVFVVGVGMTPFTKPKADAAEGPHFNALAKVALQRALADACVDAKEVELAAVGNMFVNGAAQPALYPTLMGIPMYTTQNACATGSAALKIARDAVAGGIHECTVALGVEKMKPGALGGGKPTGEPTSLDAHYYILNTKYPMEKVPPLPQFFAGAAKDYMALYPECKPRHFAMIGAKAHKHSANNPYSQFRTPDTLEDVEKSPMVSFPLTKLQCSPTSDGAACAVLASEDFVRKHGLEGQAIEILGMAARTDEPECLSMKNIKENPRSMINLVGYPMAKRAAQEAYKQAGIKPQDVQVLEVHDCFSANELLTYEALGLAPEGEGWKMVERGDNTYGGKYVVNPSGGLISKGHPLGATGLAQCAELNWQLRGECGPRQVPNAKVALQHNLGLGGLVVVTIYRKPAEWAGKPPKRKQSLAMGAPEMAAKL